jgi:peptide/nickel transport system substrate-binding protein
MRSILLKLLVFVVIFTLAACAPASAPAAPAVQQQAPAAPAAQMPQATAQPVQPTLVVEQAAPARVEVLRLVGGDYGYPSPFTRNSRGPGFINTSMIFDTLVWKDSTGQIIPWLAESWKSTPDGKVWTFSLRDGVKWQDGKPFSADDVVFSYQYLITNPGPSSPTRANLFKEIRKVDDRTIEISLNQVYAPFLSNVAGSLPILPKHIWENVKDPLKFTAQEAVIGTGPYRLLNYNKAEGSYLFEANDDFWLGKPYVKRIEMVPTNNAALSLKQGDIHAADISGYSASPDNEMMQAFKQDSKFVILKGTGEWHLALYFNLAKGLPFNDKAFRQAVAYAMDLQTMVDKVLLGDGIPGMPGWASPESVWKNPEVKSYPYQPDKAKTLLDQAGYVDKNGDGKRDLPDGKPLQLELIVPTAYPRPGEMIKAWLGAAGLDITLKIVDQTTADQATAQGKYQMALIGHGGLGGDPESMMDIYSSQSKSKSFTRVQGYTNARFDELAAKQVQTFDQKERVKMVNEMQSILAEDVPVIPLYYPNRNLVFDKTLLGNWYYTPGGIGSGVPTVWNKQLYVTGEKTGLKIMGQ